MTLAAGRRPLAAGRWPLAASVPLPMRLLLLLAASLLLAGEATPLPPGVIARVGAVEITLPQLTQALLKREGSDALLNWVQGHLDGLAWEELNDDAVVMAVGGHQLKKRELALMLVKEKGAKVREELIDISVVEQAVAKAGIAIDDALLAAEFRLMERDFQRRVAASGQGHVDFASFLRVKEKISVEQFLAQPAVRMLAGIHGLVRRQIAGEYDDARLQAKLDAERARWDERASVDLAVMHMPWKRDAAGKVTTEEQARLQGVVNLLHRQIAGKEVTFAKAWEAFGKAWDASGPGGRVGWVDAEGRRADESARRIPKPLVERAFATDGPYPALLVPHVHEAGIDLAQVLGKRPARAVTLAETRDRLIQDILERELEARTKALVAKLRSEAAIVYGSLPDAAR